MNSKLARDYINGLKTRLADESEVIAAGNAANMKEYGLACGRIQALRESLQDFQQLWEEFVRNGGEGDEIFADMD